MPVRRFQHRIPDSLAKALVADGYQSIVMHRIQPVLLKGLGADRAVLQHFRFSRKPQAAQFGFEELRVCPCPAACIAGRQVVGVVRDDEEVKGPFQLHGLAARAGDFFAFGEAVCRVMTKACAIEVAVPG